METGAWAERKVAPKRPVGVEPKDRWWNRVREARIEELMAAISRYKVEGIQPPQEWLDELRDI